MNIALAYTTDDEHKVHKYLNQLGGYSGTLRDEMSVMTPVVQVQVPETTATQANYCAMPDINGQRTFYYFIRDIVFIRSGIVELHLELDPLMTYENEIRRLDCTIRKNENVGNAFLMDSEYQILAYENIVTKEFPIGFSDESMILITVG